MTNDTSPRASAAAAAPLNDGAADSSTTHPFTDEVRKIVTAAEARPAAIHAHRDLFRLYRHHLSHGPISDESMASLFSAATTLRALTIQDCAYKLALWWHGTRDDEDDQRTNIVAGSLLGDLAQITGVEEILPTDDANSA